MRTLFAGTNVCGDLTIRYFLLAEELGSIGENYGILVESGQERETIRGITLSQRRIETLLCALMRGGVTAVTARDVVEDWLLAQAAEPGDSDKPA